MAWKEIKTNIFAHESEIRLPGAFVLPLRTVAIRQENGDVWLHCPSDISDADFDGLKEIGNVKSIVAANTFHHMFLGKAMEMFPDATTYVADGVGKKQKKLSFDQGLTGDTRWGDEITTVNIEGAPFVNESVFFHAPSRSMICTDFVLNVAQASNFVTKAFLWADDAVGFSAYTRLWRVVAKNRDALAASCEEIVQNDFERIIMAHGEIAETNVREQFERCTAKLRARL